MWKNTDQENTEYGHFFSQCAGIYLLIISKHNWSSRLVRSGNGFIWHTNLAHPQKRNFCPKNFLYLSKENQFFKQNNFSHLPNLLQKTNSPPEENISYTYLKKRINLPSKEIFFCNKKQFSKQKAFYTCVKKYSFVSDVFWRRLCYF